MFPRCIKNILVAKHFITLYLIYMNYKCIFHFSSAAKASNSATLPSISRWGRPTPCPHRPRRRERDPRWPRTPPNPAPPPFFNGRDPAIRRRSPEFPSSGFIRPRSAHAFCSLNWGATGRDRGATGRGQGGSRRHPNSENHPNCQLQKLQVQHMVFSGGGGSFGYICSSAS